MAAGSLVLNTTTINNRHIDGLVDDLVESAPLFMRLFSKPASQGHVHQWKVYDDAGAAAFRTEGNGIDETSTDETQKTVNLAILDASFSIDVATVKGSILEDLIDREARRKLRTKMFKAGKQVIYGTTALGDSGGFAGLMNLATLDALADPMVFQPATPGTTADSQSSVYFLRTDYDNISVVTDNGGDLQMGETTVQRVTGANSKPHAAYYTPLLGWYGLQTGGAYSAARLCNIETALTDDDISNVIAAFPADKVPNVIAMSRRSANLLRKSRTATNPAGAPAPFVDSVFGFPIIVTDEIVDTEPIEV